MEEGKGEQARELKIGKDKRRVGKGRKGEGRGGKGRDDSTEKIR